jgi:outer membrane protein
MNQKVINILLGAGLAILLLLQVKNIGKQTAASSNALSDSATVVKLAYVDLDSLQEKYLFYKEKMVDFDRKKESADRDLNNAFQRIENERIAFAKRGESITQAEYENFQRAYQGKMQNLEEQKRSLENTIAGEGATTMQELRNKIDKFLVEYNKTKKYAYIFSYSNSLNFLFYKDKAYDITNDVVAGLNADYNKTSGKK